MLRYLVYTFAAIWLIHAFWPSVAHAQQQPRHASQCQAIAEAIPQATFAQRAAILGINLLGPALHLNAVRQPHIAYSVATPNRLTA